MMARPARAVISNHKVRASVGVDPGGGHTACDYRHTHRQRSKILFWVPRAMASGATITVDLRTYGAHRAPSP